MPTWESELLIVFGMLMLMVSWSCFSLWLDIRRVKRRREELFRIIITRHPQTTDDSITLDERDAA